VIVVQLILTKCSGQRIALSWMVQKETSLNCSGGILADDQVDALSCLKWLDAVELCLTLF
jgi:hypothetical protein